MAKGVDVGTAFLVAAYKNNGENIIKTVRNCFISLDNLTDDIDWLKENTNSAIVELDDGRSFILGDDAMGFGASNISVRRPMQKGIINPTEEEAPIVMAKLIEMIVGKPNYSGEIVCASVPATTTAGTDSVNHSKIIEKIFTDLGYKFIPINEGLAIIYANNPTIYDEDEDKEIPFSGIGISMGGGQVNVCHAHMGIATEELTFSVERSGDWIDQKVSETFGEDAQGQLIVKPNQVAKFKEKFLNLTIEDYSDEMLEELGFKNSARKKKFKKMHFGLKSYYENLISYIIANIVSKFKQSKLESEFPVEIVISGGTSMPNGVVELFDKVLKEREDFPFDVKKVRKANDPLKSTALGALAKAISEERKLVNQTEGVANEKV